MYNLDFIMNIHEPVIKIQAKVLPNPNSSTSTINVNTMQTGKIEISILNQAGIEIESIFSGLLESGEHNFNWDGSKHPSGVYYCKITGRNINETLKIMKVD